MLPSIQYIMNLIGIEHDEIPFMISGFNPVITQKTMRNWRSGRNVPRMSTVQRHLGSFAQFVGCSDLNFEELLATSADESKSDFDILWEIFFRGIDCSSTGPDLCVTEAKRFFGYVKLLKPYFETKDLHGLAAKLEELDIPQTDVTRDAIQRLRTSNDNSHEAMALALAPIMLTNVLYLIACRDVDNEVLVKLCPLYEQDRAKWKLPSARWLDAIRQDKGISSDEKLGS